jgi:transcriptional regulator with XRE-family HTH domain
MNKTELSRWLRSRRRSLGLSIAQIATQTGISSSHLTRIETGARFPSARTLAKLSGPLGIETVDLMVLAGFLHTNKNGKTKRGSHHDTRLDPLVVEVLAQENFEVQRMVITILKMLKTMKTLL